AGARVVGAFVEARAQEACLCGAARVGPGEQLGGGPTRAVDAHQAVPVAGDTDGEDVNLTFAGRVQGAVDTLPDQVDQFVGVRRDLAGLRRADFVGHVEEARGPHSSAEVVNDGADG